MNSIKFTYDELESVKFVFRIFDILSQVLLNLFTFLINTTNQEVRALRSRSPRVLGCCATSFVSCVVYTALRDLIPHPLRGITLNYIFYRFKTHTSNNRVLIVQI